MDTPTPDLPLDRRPAHFTWPVHRTLLGHGILIAEQLARLLELPFAPLPIEGSGGSSARFLARLVRP